MRTTRLGLNLPAFALLAVAASLAGGLPDLYQEIVQEDHLLEWATFWAFVGAAGWSLLRARSARRRSGATPWFEVGLALFCLLVALEEISWGQRLLGFRPPAYFLAENYQQEFNLHNTMGDRLRELGFLGVCWGYGVILPLLQRIPRIDDTSKRWGVLGPPIEIVPTFAATALLYQLYPWSHSGEWAEAMLGAGMFFSAALQAGDARPAASRPSRLASACIVTAMLAIGSTVLVSSQGAEPDPARLEAARIELAALQADIAEAKTKTRCGIHKRMYTFVEAYGQGHLFDGEFAALTSRGLPAERARFFLDPWDSPYWIQHACSNDRRRRAVFVYSFGPNRRRESNDWEILGDDLGAWISRPRTRPGG
jgi:hypothetical protein